MRVWMPRAAGSHLARRVSPRVLRALGAFGLALCLLAGPGMPASMLFAHPVAQAAQAAEAARQTGSLTVRLLAGAGETPVAGGALALYQLAQATGSEGEGALTATPAFSVLQDALAAPSSPELASQAAELAGQASPRATAVVGQDGSCVFEDLPRGLYLVTQSEASPGYYALSPFVVVVPEPAASDSQDAYDVCATPKVEPLPGDAADDDPAKPEADEPAEDRLIQTGQLKWPVPVLAGVGVALFAAGWASDRPRGSRER